MDYDQAEKLALKTPWKIDTCHVGESCWCRIIVPETTINYQHIKDGMEDEYYIIGDGAINEDMANYIVELHNQKLKCIEN